MALRPGGFSLQRSLATLLLITAAVSVAVLWRREARAQERADRLVQAQRLLDAGQLALAKDRLLHLERQMGSDADLEQRLQFLTAMEEAFEWIRRNEPRRLLEHLDRLASRYPDQALLHVLRARALDALGHREEAAAERARAQALAPAAAPPEPPR